MAAAPRGAQADQALTARVAALETAMRPLAELASRLDTANAAARDAKSRADAAFEAAQKNAAAPAAQAADHKEIEALAARVAALEQALKSSEAAHRDHGRRRQSGRLAFVAVALRARGRARRSICAGARGRASARCRCESARRRSSRSPRPACRAPRRSRASFRPSPAPMLAAAGGPPREGGSSTGCKQNAERLVRIRPINEAPGDDPATVIGRADVKATHGDLAGAVAELGEPAGRGARAGATVGSRAPRRASAALAAARKLADDAVGALGESRSESRMIRVVVFLVAAALIALGVVWLADRPGQVRSPGSAIAPTLSVMVAIAGDRPRRDRGGVALVARRGCCCARHKLFSLAMRERAAPQGL